jgi:ribosome-associated protein
MPALERAESAVELALRYEGLRMMLCCCDDRVTHTIAIDDDELDEQFVRASGPGGQNVNKLSSAVQLRFDVRRSPNLPGDVRARLERLAGRRLTREGVLIISAQRHRTQERNRQDARERLIELIRRAAIAPIPRRATRPTAGSRERRLQSKKHRSSIKGLRQGKPAPE